MGVTEPEATFSACFGAAFLVWHPMTYADLLGKKLQEHSANAWLINTGWTGGPYGVGSRIKLAYTRAIVDAVLDGSLRDVQYTTEPVFKLQVPKTCRHVPSELLMPRQSWKDAAEFDATAAKLADLFKDNFGKYADRAAPEVLQAAPAAPAATAT